MKDYASPEVYFAQHLASNDTKIRNRAVKKLRVWLAMRSSGGVDFTEEDMLKLWKGLYYCMWMCDKPLNQESLADNISELIHCFSKPQQSLRFIDSFFQSMSKEWHGIDRYRIEKFMLLVRRFLCQTFCVLSKNQWRPKFVIKLLKVLRKHVINPLRDETPQGLKMHVMDIYLDELAKAGGCDLKPKKLNKLLKPYVIFLTLCDDSSQLKAVVNEVFHPLIWQAFHQDDDDEEKEDNEETVSFRVDFNALADLLLKQVGSTTMSTKNQKTVYKLVSQLRTAARGEFPFRNVDSDDDNEDYKLKKTDINRAAKELFLDDLKISEERIERLREMRESKKRRKKRMEEEDEEDSDNAFGEQLETLEGFQFKESEPKKKRRKKNNPGNKKPKGKKGEKLKGKVKSLKAPRRKNFKKR